MNLKAFNTVFEIRATFSSYLAISGVWIVLALTNIFLSFRSSDKSVISVALLTTGIALLSICWLRGFRVRITDNKISYRDGFYKENNALLGDIVDVKTKQVVWVYLPKNIKAPRLALISKTGDVAIMINPKPFSTDGLQTIMKKLRKE